MMDIKGIAWVGNIYQKFETMCLEVEEAMLQETAKFVDTQVQTVGASMKRFCSDVMQDIRPKDSSTLEFGIPKKPISNLVKDDAIAPVRVKGISDKKSNSSNDAWEDWSAASFNWETSDNDEANCDVQGSNEATVCKLRGQQEGDTCNVIADTSFVSPPLGTTMFNKSAAMVGKRSRCISSSNIIRAAERTEDTCESSGLVSQMGSLAISNASSSQSVEEDLPHLDPCEYSGSFSLSQTHSDIGANTQCGQPAGDEVLPTHTGTTMDSDPDLEEETENDTSVKIIEPFENESESGFEETCVLVDGIDYRPDNHKEEIRQSYKKKIQIAFSLKNKLSRKQEYKQLAAQYDKFDSIHGDKAIPLALSLSENIKSKNLATNDSIESEWELL